MAYSEKVVRHEPVKVEHLRNSMKRYHLITCYVIEKERETHTVEMARMLYCAVISDRHYLL